MTCDPVLAETIVTASWILLPLVYMVAVWGGYFVGRRAAQKEAAGITEESDDCNG